MSKQNRIFIITCGTKRPEERFFEDTRVLAELGWFGSKAAAKAGIEKWMDKDQEFRQLVRDADNAARNKRDGTSWTVAAITVKEHRDWYASTHQLKIMAVEPFSDEALHSM